MTRTACGLLVVFLAVAVAPARADSDQLLQDLKAALEERDAEAAHALLVGEDRMFIAEDAEATLLVCGYISVYARVLTVAADDPSTVRALVDEAVKLAQETCEENPEDPDGEHALAYATSSGIHALWSATTIFGRATCCSRAIPYRVQKQATAST